MIEAHLQTRADPAGVDIEVDASDLPSGVERVVLSINGELLEDAADRDPPFRWGAVALPSGVWEISAEATVSPA